MTYTNFIVANPEAVSITKEEAEKFLGIKIPNAAEGRSYWKTGNNISYVSVESFYSGSLLWPLEYWFLKENDRGTVLFRYRGTVSQNCFWTDWVKWRA